jgi:hypothetical protein
MSGEVKLVHRVEVGEIDVSAVDLFEFGWRLGIIVGQSTI